MKPKNNGRVKPCLKARIKPVKYYVWRFRVKPGEKIGV